VGCLRGGEYTDGCSVSWPLDANPRATLQSYPGEQAILHTTLGLAGDNLTASHLRVTGAGCAAQNGFTVQGANDVIEFSSVYDVSAHGVLTNPSSSNVTVHGNFIESVGSNCPTSITASTSRPRAGSRATCSRTSAAATASTSPTPGTTSPDESGGRYSAE
jgi:hypothetical protein